MTSTNPHGSEAISAALEQVVAELDPAVLESPTRLRAALSDVLGASARTHRAEIDAIALAAEAGVPASLAKRAEVGLPSPVASDLANRISAQGITTEMAHATVRALATVIPPTEPIAEATSTPTRPEPEQRPTPATRAMSVTGVTGRLDQRQSQPRRLVPVVLTAGLMAAAALVSGGIVYASTHPAEADSVAPHPVTTPTVTVTRSTTTTKTRSVTKTRTHRVTVSNGVTFDTAHFQASDYTMEFTPEVSDGPDCRMKARSGRSYSPCYWYVWPESFGRKGTTIVAARRLDGPVGRVWIQKGNVTYQVEQNGPFTVHIQVSLRNGKYYDLASLTLKADCNKNYPCGKRLYG
ncbi:MAG: hypothetical protein V9G19_20200 [Tetrasphaera sp.]